MTNTHSSKFRIAGGLLAGLTIGVTVTALATAPAGAASADGYDTWRMNYGCCNATDGGSRDTTDDAADYVVWRKHDRTAVIGDPVTFTVTVTNTG